MPRQTGVTTETASRMVLDAGAVILNYGEVSERMLGATREGSTFVVEQEIREIPVDGIRGPWMGGRRVIQEHVRLTVNMLEMTAENVAQVLAGGDNSPHGTDPYDIITRSLELADITYLTNIALVADYSGSTDPVIIVLKNAIADGNFEVGFTDREEPTAEIQFTAHFDPAALDTSPFEIRFPQ